MKRLLSVLGLLVSLSVPVSASSLTLESFQFLRSGQVKHYGLAAQFDANLSPRTSVSAGGRKALDVSSWSENRIFGSLTQQVGHGAFLRFEYQNYFDQSQERYWFTVGKKINL